jgi:hypothetical protein
MSDQLIRTRCVCGWETSGPTDVVVAATIEHGRRIHNMVGTPEQVLEQAEIMQPGDVEAGDGIAGSGSTGA